MLDRLRSVSLPSLSGAVDAARSAVGQGTQAVTSLGASVSTFATDTLARVERPSFTWVPDFPSLSVPAWLVRSGVAPDRLALALSTAGHSAAPTIEGWENPVGMSGLKWDHFFPNADQDWSEQVDLDGLTRFLRSQHPDKTAQHVSARTKLPADTVRKWLLGVAVPNGRAMLVLACAFGPEVLRAMLRHPPGWLDEAAQAAEQARLQAQLADLQAQIGRVA